MKAAQGQNRALLPCQATTSLSGIKWLRIKLDGGYNRSTMKNHTRLSLLIFFLVAGVLSACSSADPEDGSSSQASAASQPEASGPLLWNILPQFPPRDEVISRRLLGLNDLTMVDANTAWIVGTDGGIGYTTNAGIDWVLQKTGTAVNLTSVSFVDATQGWVVGTAGTLLHTTDSGTTWTPLEGIKGVFSLDGIDFVSATTGWTVSDTGGVYM